MSKELLGKVRELKKELYKWEQIKSGDNRYKQQNGTDSIKIEASQKIFEIKNELEEVYKQLEQ